MTQSGGLGVPAQAERRHAKIKKGDRQLFHDAIFIRMGGVVAEK
jgi:hypothetical protein